MATKKETRSTSIQKGIPFYEQIGNRYVLSYLPPGWKVKTEAGDPPEVCGCGFEEFWLNGLSWICVRCHPDPSKPFTGRTFHFPEPKRGNLKLAIAKAIVEAKKRGNNWS